MKYANKILHSKRKFFDTFGLPMNFRQKVKERLLASRSHNSTEHPKLISIPYIYPIGQDIAIEIGYPISVQKYV